MITIISGSNRVDNRTIPFAKYVYDQLVQEGHDAQLLNLESLEGEIISSSMYSKTDQPNAIKEIQDQFFIPANKFWFFIPEYNGSYPGVLKVLIDIMSTRDLEETFKDKKASLTGIALGRAGNLRGMDHLAEVLNHVGIHVHPNKKPISSIYQMVDDSNVLIDDKIKNELSKQMIELLSSN